MHRFSFPPELVDRVRARGGKAHPFDVLIPAKTAFVVIDMQNYFMQPGYPGEVAGARAIVPHINYLAKALRAAGGHVVWIKNATDNTRESWSVLHDGLLRPEIRDRRYACMDTSHTGHRLWQGLDVRPNDAQIVKTRYSAFIDGSSPLASHLRERGIDTVLIGGTATNVCCESSARDAMMLNFRVVMVHDALAALTDAEHEATLRTFYMMFGDVQSVDEAVASLERGKALPATGPQASAPSEQVS